VDEPSYGLIEIVLAFSVILGLAVWELIRNRRALARIKAVEKQAGRCPSSD
jgi:cytochrome oxidase assembly protein ShyY1